MCLVSHMEGASEVLRDATKRGEKLCGVASEVNQFCCLYPVKEQPNFAGPNAIGQFTYRERTDNKQTDKDKGRGEQARGEKKGPPTGWYKLYLVGGSIPPGPT